MKEATWRRNGNQKLDSTIRPHKRSARTRNLAITLILASVATPTSADLTFTQTVDGWWENSYAWDAQTETIICRRGFDPVGTIKSIWGRVVQKNGSKVGNAVFCTTMTKTSTGLTDTWDVAVPAGTIDDCDFWDASTICFELVDCDTATGISYHSLPTEAGILVATDYPSGELAEDLNIRYISIDPGDWDDQLVRDIGFDFAVYGYMDGPLPIILNHVDELGLSTFSYDQTDAFGTGMPFDPHKLAIIGIDLDPSWDFLAKKSTGLQVFEWQLFPKGGLLITDQGAFQILQAQPLIPGWLIICAADLNADGQLNFFDISVFIKLFQAQDPAADFNNDGEFNFFDISAFVQAFSSGCP